MPMLWKRWGSLICIQITLSQRAGTFPAITQRNTGEKARSFHADWALSFLNAGRVLQSRAVIRMINQNTADLMVNLN